jgi:hypothetical protein
MKTTTEKDKIKKAEKKPVTQNPGKHKSEELKTDPPISEKDEVKNAEKKMNEFAKKHL